MKFFQWFIKNKNMSPGLKKEINSVSTDFSELSQPPFDTRKQNENSTNDLTTLRQIATAMKELERVSQKAYYKMLASTIELAYLDIAQKRFAEQEKG
jgi:hypothetical protein